MMKNQKFFVICLYPIYFLFSSVFPAALGYSEKSISSESKEGIRKKIETDSDNSLADVKEEKSNKASNSEIGTTFQPNRDNGTISSSNGRSEPKSSIILGSSRVNIGASVPAYNSNLLYYKEAYGKPKWGPEFGVDYYFFNGYVTPGLGFKLAYIQASGNALLNTNNGYTVDNDSNTELKLLPIQVKGLLQFTPLRSHFICINVWGGVERLSFQETRYSNRSSTGGGEGEGDSVYINEGANMGTVQGASVSLLLDFLDEKSVHSLAFLGFRSIYLTVFSEKTQINKEPNFGRTTNGILFTFETSR
ncbi:MAG: hypothetical protein HQK54_02405 [Oligoflexales bacterium]|nr:hypothetical protein [Oligoflexales bacterium]